MTFTREIRRQIFTRKISKKNNEKQIKTFYSASPVDGESSCKDLEYFSSGVTPTDLPLSLRSQSSPELEEEAEGVEKLL